MSPSESLPGQRQADFRAEGRKAGLLEGRAGRGAFAFQGVTDGTFEGIGLQVRS